MITIELDEIQAIILRDTIESFIDEFSEELQDNDLVWSALTGVFDKLSDKLDE